MSNKAGEMVEGEDVEAFINTRMSRRGISLHDLRSGVRNDEVTPNRFPASDEMANRIAMVLKLNNQERAKFAKLTGLKLTYDNSDILKLIDKKLVRVDELGETERSISKAVGGSPSFIPRLRSGDRRLTLTTASKLAEVLKFDAREKRELFGLMWNMLTGGLRASSTPEEGKNIWLRVQGDLGRVLLDVLGLKDENPGDIASISIDRKDGNVMVEVKYHRGSGKAVAVTRK